MCKLVYRLVDTRGAESFRVYTRFTGTARGHLAQHAAKSLILQATLRYLFQNASTAFIRRRFSVVT